MDLPIRHVIPAPASVSAKESWWKLLLFETSGMYGVDFPLQLEAMTPDQAINSWNSRGARIETDEGDDEQTLVDRVKNVMRGDGSETIDYSTSDSVRVVHGLNGSGKSSMLRMMEYSCQVAQRFNQYANCSPWSPQPDPKQEDLEPLIALQKIQPCNLKIILAHPSPAGWLIGSEDEDAPYMFELHIDSYHWGLETGRVKNWINSIREEDFEFTFEDQYDPLRPLDSSGTECRSFGYDVRDLDVNQPLLKVGVHNIRNMITGKVVNVESIDFWFLTRKDGTHCCRKAWLGEDNTSFEFEDEYGNLQATGTAKVIPVDYGDERYTVFNPETGVTLEYAWSDLMWDYDALDEAIYLTMNYLEALPSLKVRRIDTQRAIAGRLDTYYQRIEKRLSDYDGYFSFNQIDEEISASHSMTRLQQIYFRELGKLLSTGEQAWRANAMEAAFHQFVEAGLLTDDRTELESNQDEMYTDMFEEMKQVIQKWHNSRFGISGLERMWEGTYSPALLEEAKSRHIHFQTCVDICGRLASFPYSLELFVQILNSHLSMNQQQLTKEVNKKEGHSKSSNLLSVTMSDKDGNLVSEDQPLSIFSDGETHLFLMFAELCCFSDGAIVLIDEPEISLHIYWQEAFLPNLMLITSKRHSQAIVASHAPMLVAGHSELCVDLDPRIEQME